MSQSPTSTSPAGDERPASGAKIRVFYSYSHKDELLRDELNNHLSMLKRDGIIEPWHDRQIEAGTEWKDQIDANLEAAEVILLLVSSDFLASDYCYEKEMKRALARHAANSAKVIPVILRDCDWKNAPFGKLQGLPREGKPITSWPNRDEAFSDVARGIRKAIAEMRLASAQPDEDPCVATEDPPPWGCKPQPQGESGGSGDSEEQCEGDKNRRTQLKGVKITASATIIAALIGSLGLAVKSCIDANGDLSMPRVKISRPVGAEVISGDLSITVDYRVENLNDGRVWIDVASDATFRGSALLKNLEVSQSDRPGPQTTVTVQDCDAKSGYVRVRVVNPIGKETAEDTAPFSLENN